MLVFEH